MVIKKAVFISVLFASLASSGCAFTQNWNRMIDSQVTGCLQYSSEPCKVQLSTKTFSHDPDSFGINDNGKHPEYRKCDYLGEEIIKGDNYNRYMCPNMYNDSRHAFLELFIPDAGSTGNKMAIIKSRWLLWAKRKNIDIPVYIRFTTSTSLLTIGDGRIKPISPNFIRNSVDRSLGNRPFPENIPSLISMNYDLRFHSISLHAGERMERSEAIDMLNSRYAPNPQYGRETYVDEFCPETNTFIPFRHATGNPACELWYTPDMLAIGTNPESGTPVETSDKTILWEITRYIGDIIAVPLDIITSPVQLLITVKYASH